MTATYRVRWTPEAEADAATIVDWFDDSMNALKAIDQLEEKANSLALMPERGRVVPELREIGVLQYHEVFHKPWRMVYVIRGHDVWIMAVLDGRRDLAALLYERLAK